MQRSGSAVMQFLCILCSFMQFMQTPKNYAIMPWAVCWWRQSLPTRPSMAINGIVSELRFWNEPDSETRTVARGSSDTSGALPSQRLTATRNRIASSMICPARSGSCSKITGHVQHVQHVQSSLGSSEHKLNMIFEIHVEIMFLHHLYVQIMFCMFEGCSIFHEHERPGHDFHAPEHDFIIRNMTAWT